MTDKEEYLLYKYNPKIDVKIHLNNNTAVTTLLDIDEISGILDVNRSKYINYDKYIEGMIKLLCNINIIISNDYADITSVLHGRNSCGNYCYNITHEFDESTEYRRYVLYAQYSINTNNDNDYDILTETPVVDILHKVHSALSDKNEIRRLISTNTDFMRKDPI